MTTRLYARITVREKAGLAAFAPRKSNGGKRFTFSNKPKPAKKALTDKPAIVSETTAPEDKKVAAIYDYCDDRGELLYQVVRYDPKDFRQRRPDGKGGWIWSVRGCRRVLYRLADLLAAAPDAPVTVTEGEKDADRGASLGLCTVTIACGDWTKDCIEALRGRDVLIPEDADKPGMKKSRKAASLLHGVAKTVRIVRLPDQEHTAEHHGKDLSDWFDDDPTRNADSFLKACLAVPLWTPDTAQAEATTEEAPTTNVADLPLSINVWLGRDLPEPDYLIGNWLTTTSRVLFAADTGLGKTNFALTAFAHLATGRDFLHWHIPQPRRVLYVDGEMSRRLLKQRLEDIVRRLGVAPDALHVLSHEDVEGFAPLNTEVGQKYTRLYHLEVIDARDVLDNAVAGVVPDVDAKTEVRLGLHGGQIRHWTGPRSALNIAHVVASRNLKPFDYLWMLKEEYVEFKRDPAFVRKAIICCALSNALPEIIFAEYRFTEPHRVHHVKSLLDYREYLRGECEAHHTVRDICDFSKHGPKLHRESVSVRSAKPIRRLEGIYQGLLALTGHREIEKLVIEHKDGRTELIDDVLQQVVASWDAIFPRDGL
jgi:hypothetical protein